MDKFDVVVIGAGPGGYVAAIRCGQLGLKTACIEKWTDADDKLRLGGTCLNVGCIPSKALLDSSEQYHKVQHDMADHGIGVGKVQIDVTQMMKRKQRIVDTLTGGIGALFMKNKVKSYHGLGRFVDPNTIEIVAEDGSKQQISAKHIIIATGSTPTARADAPFDGERILDSTAALSLDAVPKRLGVIGSGVIGLELGSVWNRLGSEVTVFNRSGKILRRLEPELAREAEAALTTQGIQFIHHCTIDEIKVNKNSVNVRYHSGDEEHKIQLDKLLIATGRQPNTEGLNLDAAGLNCDDRGFIKVDDHCRTEVDHIFAIGDVTRGPMLAHKASEEGVAVAETLAGQIGHVNYRTIPWVIYTWPEVAWVGKTSEQLQQEGVAFKAGSFPFKGNGRAYAVGETRGLVKILADSKSDEILGVHMIGPWVSELITEAVVAMEFNASAEDLARTVHGHPTLSEAVHEAALAVDRRTIHI